MQFVCQHDPLDPNHLICETKLPWRHRVFEIGLGVLMAALLGISIVLFVKTPPVDKPEDYLITPYPSPFPQGEREIELVQIEGETKSPLYSGQIKPSLPYLETEALYFSKEGEQLGRGPWPPKVGEETRLKVFWRVAGAGAGVVVGGKLGSHAEWTGFAPQAQGLSYEPATRMVRWNVRCQMSEVKCDDSAVFEVAITPTAQQLAGKQLIVVDNLKMVITNREILNPSILISW
ncbi:hypothetical protein HYW17_01470 [Candidatus Uhrbacteria bacterium]|nr:hypothetical protein [Candidatus Uhrbacteria bacterium]